MVIELIFSIAAFYLFAGLLFAFIFFYKGIRSVDEGSIGSSIGFKIIIIPGIMVFWPVLLKKWIRVSKKKKHE
jgi:hypothetical protein